MAVTKFEVRALSGPQALMRLLDHFAKIGVTPSHVHAVKLDEWLDVQIDQPGLNDLESRLIAERMRGSVFVKSVRMKR